MFSTNKLASLSTLFFFFGCVYKRSVFLTRLALIKAPVSSLEKQHLVASDCLMFSVQR